MLNGGKSLMIDELTWQMASGLELPISIKGFLNQEASYEMFKETSNLEMMDMIQKEIEGIEVLTYSCRTALAYDILAFIVKIDDTYRVAIVDIITNEVVSKYNSDLETNKPYARFLEQLEKKQFKKMAQAKDSAIKQMNAILQKKEIAEKTKGLNPYEMMLLRRMGKQIVKKEGYDFSVIETGLGTLEIIASGETISPTVFARFKQPRYDAVANHYFYDTTFKYEGDIDYLHLVRDYFSIRGVYGQGAVEKGYFHTYFWSYKDDIDFNEFDGDYTVLNSYLQYVLDCFEENSKKDEDIEKSDLYGIPEYVSKILGERQKLDRNVLDNSYVPFTAFKDHYRQKGNRNNPSRFFIMKGTEVMVSFWITYKRNSYEVKEAEIKNYISAKTNEGIMLEIEGKINTYKNNVRISRDSLLTFIKELYTHLNQYYSQNIQSVKRISPESGRNWYWYQAYPEEAFALYGKQEEITIEVTDLLGIDTKQQVIERNLEGQVYWDEESGLWEYKDEDEEDKYYDLDPLSEN